MGKETSKDCEKEDKQKSHKSKPSKPKPSKPKKPLTVPKKKLITKQCSDNKIVCKKVCGNIHLDQDVHELVIWKKELNGKVMLPLPFSIVLIVRVILKLLYNESQNLPLSSVFQKETRFPQQ